MGKNYSKGAKRRAKKALPKLAETPRRQPNGQRRHRADAPKDPLKTALSARCRIFGVPDTPTNRKALSGQHSGSQIGMVMLSECDPGDIPGLWSVWQGFCMAERTYRIRILGMSVTAKGAAIQMVPDKMEADQSHTIDTRDSDTRDRDAVNNWMHWRGLIGQLHTPQQSLLHRAEQDNGRALWNEGPTPTGKATLDALKALAEAKETRG